MSADQCERCGRYLYGKTELSLFAERDQLRARVAELEALISGAAHVLCEQMPLPNAEYVANDHNAAVLAIRKKAAALEGKGEQA